MTNDERAQLDVLREQINGKLDVIIERIGNLLLQVDRHETRIFHLEDKGSRNAQEAVQEIAEIKSRLHETEMYLSGEKMTEYGKNFIGRFEQMEQTVRGIGIKIATATGVIGALIFVINFGLSKKWF